MRVAGPALPSPRVIEGGKERAAGMSVSVAAGNLPMRLLRKKIHKRNLKLRAAEQEGTAGRGRAGGPGASERRG